METGDPLTLNQRKIYQYIHPNVCESCLLQMGYTILEPGSAWNTMPCHTHERRMEAYVYFDMEEDTRIFHMMGKPDETKHLVMSNEQAAISPSWSIHSGVGTSNYSFIWAMCGENLRTDMDMVAMDQLNKPKKEEKTWNLKMNDFQLDGKVALITGAVYGIGFEIAEIPS